jgi:hypothetical protein
MAEIRIQSRANQDNRLFPPEKAVDKARGPWLVTKLDHSRAQAKNKRLLGDGGRVRRRGAAEHTS